MALCYHLSVISTSTLDANGLGRHAYYVMSKEFRTMLQWNWPGPAWHGWPTPPDSAGAPSISGRNGNRCCACARGSLIIDHLDGLCIPLVYCAATVVLTWKPIGRDPRQLSAIGLKLHKIWLLSGTARLKPRVCIRERYFEVHLQAGQIPYEGMSECYGEEWNKYKHLPKPRG